MAVLAVPEDITDAVAAQWDNIAAPGAALTGAQRIAAARRARDPASEGLSDSSAEAVDRLAHDAHHITAEWVDSLLDRELTSTSYVELMGIVARLAVVDTFDRAMGDPVRPLPVATPGAPTGAVDGDAKQRAGFIPTVGAVGPPSALSLIPTEMEAQFVLHDAFYLTIAGMLDFVADRDLRRTQIELVAARTSLANDCFY